MAEFTIEGGHSLHGNVTPSGNKNAALPILAATLLTDQPITLDNIPRIRDVDAMLQLLADVGAEVHWTGDNSLRVQAANLHKAKFNPMLCQQIRASILLAGPMLARAGRVTLPPPGGDIIGRRPVDTHLLALRSLGAKINLSNDGYDMLANGLQGDNILLNEASVTATENALMAAATAGGRTVIHNAASEPHVQDLARFLNTLGARVTGIGSNTLRIEGVDRLAGGHFSIAPDYIEVGSYIGLAAVCGDGVTIVGAAPDDLRMTRLVFRRLGVEIETTGDDVYVPPQQSLQIVDAAGGAVPKIDDGPWPAFPSDLMSIALVVATQAQGTILIHEKMFESRLYFVDKLITMGARIILCDPHRAVVVGPAQLHAAQLESPDIRAGMALLIAALAAQGRSEIGNISQIDRGYERIDTKLRSLGAHVERVS